jgi:hypothetical protein
MRNADKFDLIKDPEAASLAAALAPWAPAGGAVARWWRGFLKDLFRPYRPERHYMRGPGPKWREKHGRR